MDYYYSQKSPETTTTHRKTPPFHIEGLLGLDKAPAADTKAPPTPTPSDVPVEVPAPPRRGIRRRPRTVYTPEQREGLEAVFAANQYPDITSRDTLADALDMTEARVQVWFQNRRARIRRQAKRKASSPAPSNTSSSTDQDRSASPPEHQATTETFRPSSSPIASNIGDVSAPRTEDLYPRCRQACCSPPPIICTDASCYSCPAATCMASSQLNYPTVPTYGPTYGLPQQYYSAGAFPYPTFSHQYGYYYRSATGGGNTSVSSVCQGVPICSVPSFPPVHVMNACQ